jgi:ADP-heptose:LPS heptosyltransferase
MLNRVSNIIISRTDSIGDMVLALPVAKILKDKYPHVTITILGKEYTRAIAVACEYVDAFIDMEDFFTKNILVKDEMPQAIIFLNTNTKVVERAYKLKIPVRIGPGRNFSHLKNCNYRVWFSRRKSGLHEAQLNLKLLRPFGIEETYSLKTIGESYGLTQIQPLSNKYAALIKNDRYNLIIHPKSQGNAREWSIEHFTKLIRLLDDKTYNIFVSGTEKERIFIQPLLNATANKVTDIIGSIPLDQFISFVNECDGIVANSTGPLHIAAALQKDALGLYPPLKTKDAGRWGPVGSKAQAFTLNKFCEICKLNNDFCECINSIQPETIKAALDKLAREKLKLIYVE